MDALVLLGVVVGLLYWLRWLHVQLMPEVVRLGERVVRQVGRGVVGIVWSQPVRRWGVGFTLWCWGLVGAVSVTFGMESRGVGGFAAVGLVWLGVVAAWWMLRTLARWRYRPWRLPHRWRGRW